ncbi:hypothetical protein FRACYDRAFT_269545 [Fragilariopsis cylindrus CCMP1102]|uniref:Uncharacterized protein n=1 Tax=Fragilariopsis cylindrus CCMP1102 TaxID=635003 RepID=A0A1E7F7P6_9STRA|nr:hypothetical protein FRACYDRAFT_269545 [Fragilariopsis cylindrus CCMP1102]|eukprot:OEU14190.1 hypothetical protein FRACYDRAFT_269545 [Fragilariopsis cylindrus CCMP1102]
MCCGYGLGSFSGLVDGVEMFSNDGEFDTSTNQTFTVPDGAPSEFPTSSPTSSPTDFPTFNPTVIEDICADKDNFRWKGKENRDCQWLRRKKGNKRKKLCTRFGKVGGEKLRVYEWCPTTCATVDLGACT